MRIGRALLATTAVLALAPAARAGEEGESFTIAGTSTVRDWTCQVPEHEERVSAGGASAEAVLSGAAQVSEVEIVVPVGAIECGNGKMNDHLRKALDADGHPTVTYRLSSYDVAAAADGAEVTTEGTLTIHGETLPLELRVKAASAGGALRVVGEREIDMTEWGVKPPSLMLGTIKVGETVTVGFDVTLRP